VTNRIVKVILRGDIADLQAKMAIAGKSIADTADKATGASKASQEYRRHLSALGTTAGAVGLVAAAGLGVAVAAAARFDSSMSKVQAATHETAGNMDLLRAAAIKAGADTVFSATEAADAITALAKAGVSAQDVLAGGLAGALSLASAGELDVASAAEIAATAMTQFGLSGKDIPHIADLLAAGAGKAQGEVTDMAAALKYVGPVAHQMGISIEETTGAIAELASQGILGEQAGTSLRGMLTSLTSPSKLAATEMKKLGINLYDATGNFVGLDGVAGQLHDTMSGLTNAERDQALGRIFGNEQITAARILYAGGAEAVDKWTRAVNDQGYAADTAAIKMDNLKGDLEQLKGSFETALIGLGEGDQGPLRDLVQGLTDAVNAFNDLPGPAKSAATALLGITAVTGGALWFGSKVLKGVAETRVALSGLGVEAVHTRAALAGIGKGLELAAILEGLSLFDAGLQKLSHSNVDTSSLETDLEKLGRTGEISGTLLKTFGGDLEHFGKQADAATSTLPKVTDKLFGFLPGSTSVETASKNFKKIDEALAVMVQSGHADEATKAFAALAAGADKYGVSAGQLAGFLPSYNDELAKGSGAAQLMSDAMTGLVAPTDGATGAVGALGRAAQQSTADLAAQAKALEDSRNAANQTAHEFFGLGKSVDDTKVSLHDWITDLQKQATALRDFTKNAKDAGEKGLKQGLIAELEAAGPAGALRMQQLADASEKEIHRANRAWRLGQTAIDDYTDAVGGVPPSVATDLQVNGVPVAITAVAALKRLMDSLHDRNINVKVTKFTSAAVAEAAANNADGGTIPHAAAGWTVAGPRHPYGDKVLAYLAPGEEVITNRHGEADQFRADRAAGRIPAYAAGTPVSVPASSGITFDYSRMAAPAAADRAMGFRDARDAHLSALRTAFREQPVQRTPRDQLLLYGATG
jgi:TP901 family phage tail tape measure protein